MRLAIRVLQCYVPKARPYARAFLTPVSSKLTALGLVLATGGFSRLFFPLKFGESERKERFYRRNPDNGAGSDEPDLYGTARKFLIFDERLTA